MATGARYRTVAIGPSPRSVSITLTISKAMKCEMGTATQAAADASSGSPCGDEATLGLRGRDQSRTVCVLLDAAIDESQGGMFRLDIERGLRQSAAYQHRRMQRQESQTFGLPADLQVEGL